MLIGRKRACPVVRRTSDSCTMVAAREDQAARIKGVPLAGFRAQANNFELRYHAVDIDRLAALDLAQRLYCETKTGPEFGPGSCRSGHI